MATRGGICFVGTFVGIWHSCNRLAVLECSESCDLDGALSPRARIGGWEGARIMHIEVTYLCTLGNLALQFFP